MRGNKIASLQHACFNILSTCAKLVQFCCLSHTYTAILFCTIFPFLPHVMPPTWKCIFIYCKMDFWDLLLMDGTLLVIFRWIIKLSKNLENVLDWHFFLQNTSFMQKQTIFWYIEGKSMWSHSNAFLKIVGCVSNLQKFPIKKTPHFFIFMFF